MMELISFAASFLALLFGHGLLFVSLVDLFSITSRFGQIFLGLTMLFLLLSNLLASYLIHKKDNLFTRWYYIITVFCLGISAQMFVVAIFIVILKVVGAWLGLIWPPWLLQFIFFALSIFISMIAVYQARNIRVKTYEVKIKNLPEAWVDKTVVQVSDVHLGPIYRKDFFDGLIDQVAALKPEAVFITGDLFDGTEAEFSWLNHPFKRLQAPRGIYYSFGNHDLYLGFNRVKKLLKGNPVVVLDDKMVVVDNLQIIGINYSFDSSFDLESAILKQMGYTPDRPSILLFHAPKNIRLARKVGIDLQLSGHTHDGQLFPFNLVAKWMYRGYGYGFFQKGDFNLIVSSGVGTWGPPFRTAAGSEIVKIVLRRK